MLGLARSRQTNAGWVQSRLQSQSGAQALEALLGLSQGEAVFDPTVAADVQVQRVKTGHLLVRPVINDKDAGWFIFDTGAGICVVSTSHVEPLGLAGAFVLAGAAVASPPLRPVAYNALVVLAFCFGLQGLAVVAYYLRRLAAPALLIAIVMAVLLLPYALYVLALLGLFDIFIDFRKWAEPPVAEG